MVCLIVFLVLPFMCVSAVAVVVIVKNPLRLLFLSLLFH